MVNKKLFLVFAFAFWLTLGAGGLFAGHAKAQAVCGRNLAYLNSCNYCGHVSAAPHAERPMTPARWWYSPDNASP